MFKSWPHSITAANTKETVLSTNDGVNAAILFVSLNNTGDSPAIVDVFDEIEGTDYLALRVELKAQGSVDGPSHLRTSTKIIVPGGGSLKIQSDQIGVEALFSGEEYPVEEDLEYPGIYMMNPDIAIKQGVGAGGEIIDRNNMSLAIIMNESEYALVNDIQIRGALFPQQAVTIAAAHGYYNYNTSCAIAVKSDGTVVTAGSSSDDCVSAPKSWTDIVAVDVGMKDDDYGITVGLKSNGDVIAAGSDVNGCVTDANAWTDVVSVAAGCADASNGHIVAAKSDGTVVAAGTNENGCVSTPQTWTDIVAVAADYGTNGDAITVGLKSDGTVVAAGVNTDGWSNIVAIDAASGNHAVLAVGLKSDGTVVFAGDEVDVSISDVSTWTDIVGVAAAVGDSVTGFILGLKSDGTVVATGDDTSGCVSAVQSWTDIVAIDAGHDRMDASAFVLGLKSDGTVVAAGENTSGCVSTPQTWTDILIAY